MPMTGVADPVSEVSHNGRAGGEISGFSLTSILQIIALDKEDAAVQVVSGRHRGTIYIAQGELIDAAAEGKTGLEAVYAICSWPEPLVRMGLLPGQCQRTVHAPLLRILLEVSCQQDEQKYQPPVQSARNIPSDPGGRRQSRKAEAQRIIKPLMSLPEVLHCSVCDEYGQILAQSSKTVRFQEPLKYAMLVCEEMRNILREGGPEYIELVSGRGEVLMLIPEHDRVIGLFLRKAVAPRTLIGQVRERVQKALAERKHD